MPHWLSSIVSDAAHVCGCMLKSRRWGAENVDLTSQEQSKTEAHASSLGLSPSAAQTVVLSCSALDKSTIDGICQCPIYRDNHSGQCVCGHWERDHIVNTNNLRIENGQNKGHCLSADPDSCACRSYRKAGNGCVCGHRTRLAC